MKRLPTGNDMTALMESAVTLHEMFTAYVQAGFTPEEALQIIIGIMAAGIKGQDQ